MARLGNDWTRWVGKGNENWRIVRKIERNGPGFKYVISVFVLVRISASSTRILR